MSHTPREQWDCANCRTAGELDRHGRCATCGSDQVISEHGRGLGREAREVAELERMVGVKR